MSADPDARALGAAEVSGDHAAGSDAGTDAGSDNDGLLSRLALIEQQPLEDRAAAFTQLYEQLRAALDAGDAAPR